jgi:hypothetical protein
MGSDNGNSRQDKMERIIRLSQGKTPAEVDADLAQEYVLKPHEVEAARAFVQGQSLPKYKAMEGILTMAFDHPRQEVALAVVMRAWGITDENLYYGLVKQLTNAVSKGQTPDMNELNTAIAMVAGIEPRNHLEAMLAVQMTSVHILAMKHSRSMLTVETIDQLDIQERTINKLMRTFTSQMEALRKHRNGGNQKVVVEHVHVHEGGQAIVGNVTHGGRASKGRDEQFHGQEDISVSASAAVLGHIEADRMPMSSASGEGKEPVPVPRRKGGSSQG